MDLSSRYTHSLALFADGKLVLSVLVASLDALDEYFLAGTNAST